MSNVPPDAPRPASPAPRPAPPQVVIQQRPPLLGRFGKLLLVLLVLAVMTIVGLVGAYQSYFSPPGEPQERYHSLNKEATDKIAIITVAGTLMESDGFIKKQIDRVKEDDSVKAVVLRVDSPGGTVNASDYLYHHLREMLREKDVPMVVSMGSMCASGGYYVAMAVGDQEQAIFAEPTTWTGSIGVVIPHYNVSGLLESWNIQDDSIASHRYKLMGSPTRELTDEQREEEQKLFQDLVDKSFTRFRDIVAEGRPKLSEDEEKLGEATTGRIFTAEEAQELGLVDEIGFIEKAVERAAELAGLSTKNLRCVKYTEPPTSLTSLLSAETDLSVRVAPDLQALMDLTVPKAYYLCTWLPPIVSNSAR